MPELIQPDSFSQLDKLIIDAINDARIPLASPELAMTCRSRYLPQLAVGRCDEDGSSHNMRLAVSIEAESGKSLIQVHKLGWYVTGSAVVFSPKNQPVGLEMIYDPEFLKLTAVVRGRVEAGDFKPRSFWRSFLEFMPPAMP